MISGFEDISFKGYSNSSKTDVLPIRRNANSRIHTEGWGANLCCARRYKKNEAAARAILAAVAGPPGEQFATFEAIDKVLKKIGPGALKKRDDLLEALGEDDFIDLDTTSQIAKPASRLVPIWVRARAWGRRM